LSRSSVLALVVVVGGETVAITVGGAAAVALPNTAVVDGCMGGIICH